MEVTLHRRKLMEENLLQFGFHRDGDGYLYTTALVDGQFLLTVRAEGGRLDATLTDTDSGEPYVLHLSDSAGAYVGRVREEYRAVLDRIIDACCESDVFKAQMTKQLIAYVRETYGDELEFLWEKFADNAVWRRRDNRKWYAAILTVSRRKLGLSSDEIVEILDFRMEPEILDKTVDAKRYFRGWHMNKRSWATIVLDGTVAFDEICRRLDESYRLAGGKK